MQGNLYLDFGKNIDNLNKAAKKIRVRHPSYFKNIDENESELQYIINMIFADGMSAEYYISNTSLKEDVYDFTIRPKIGPRLERIFDDGFTIAIKGYLDKSGNYLIIYRIIDIFNTEKMDFEVELIATTISKIDNMNRIYKQDFVITPEFIASLPEISKITAQRLSKWENYLNWREELIKSKIEGVRYVNIEIDEEYILFYLIFKNEDAFRNFNKFLRKDELMVFPLNYSKDEWNFEYNYENNISGKKIGNYKGKIISFYMKDKEDDKDDLRDKLKKYLEDCEWDNPYIAVVKFELSDEDQEDMLNCPEDMIEYYKTKLTNQYPKQGFLSISSVGEFSLIRRQKRTIDLLKKGEVYAPFICSWLFDIKKANVLRSNNLIEVQEWFNRSINDEQKDAVQKMLNAPDVFLIQGPPGTGKTTVIAEAIYQFAIRNQKVILASQANLAVDNVFDRLANSPKIRAIRLGCNEKISDEGKQFTEENVLKYF